MRENTTRALVEAMVRFVLRQWKDSPERGIRNMIEMAQSASRRSRNKAFFKAAQALFADESSAYYGLVKDLAAYCDLERIVTLGMNVGYGSFTAGAAKISANEKEFRCRLPWNMRLETGAWTSDHLDAVQSLISQAEDLGIYFWFVFAGEGTEVSATARIMAEHPFSAFCIFSEAEDFVQDLPYLEKLPYNVLPAVRIECSRAIFPEFRRLGVPYAVYIPYDDKDVPAILDGDLLADAEQLHPLFTGFLRKPSCSPEAGEQVHQAVAMHRTKLQDIQTILVELEADTQRIDMGLVGSVCAIRFDEEGNCFRGSGAGEPIGKDILADSLLDILTVAYPK